MTFWQVYLLEINVVALLLSAIDKACARKAIWRVSEVTLLLSAVLGGSVGLLLGILLFRHKTKHLRFSLGLPVMLLMHIALLVLLYLYTQK